MSEIPPKASEPAETPETFELTDATKEKLKAFSCTASWHQAMDKFFAFWETENNPRKAGSIVAHGLVRNAARVAVFGAVCSGNDPREDWWLALCKDHFDEALVDVAACFKEEPGVQVTPESLGRNVERRTPEAEDGD